MKSEPQFLTSKDPAMCVGMAGIQKRNKWISGTGVNQHISRKVITIIAEQ
jgi:hypothetical protein